MNEKQKNPGRVAAGKAAAAARLRLGGKFVSRKFEAEVQRMADAVGHWADLQLFADKNKTVLRDLYEHKALRDIRERSDVAIFKELSQVADRQKILLNGEDSTEDAVKYHMLTVQQWLQSNTNAAGIAFQPNVYFNNRYEITLPTLEELEELLEYMDETELAEYLLDNYGVRVWISPKKRKKGESKQAHNARVSKIERKQAATQKALKNASAKIRTKRRRS